ncbi:hypothetical protein Sjap_021698 [Stephania japonica]|uniref:Uncharacterized protein n=1 Tax=Stephania japonica TaxID=461633 RepID=A0AAP0EMF1_9MAGN
MLELDRGVTIISKLLSHGGACKRGRGGHNGLVVKIYKPPPNRGFVVWQFCKLLPDRETIKLRPDRPRFARFGRFGVAIFLQNNTVIFNKL